MNCRTWFSYCAFTILSILFTFLALYALSPIKIPLFTYRILLSTILFFITDLKPNIIRSSSQRDSFICETGTFQRDVKTEHYSIISVHLLEKYNKTYTGRRKWQLKGRKNLLKRVNASEMREKNMKVYFKYYFKILERNRAKMPMTTDLQYSVFLLEKIAFFLT